jgi:hypothetical protein
MLKVTRFIEPTTLEVGVTFVAIKISEEKTNLQEFLLLLSM